MIIRLVKHGDTNKDMMLDDTWYSLTKTLKETWQSCIHLLFPSLSQQNA